MNLGLTESSVEWQADSTPPNQYQPPQMSDEELEGLRRDANNRDDAMRAVTTT